MFLIAALACLAIVPMASANPSDDKPGDKHVFESKIRIDGAVFSLRASVKPVRVDWINDGWLVHYTVRRGDKFMHPATWEGGRLVGCRYASEDVAGCKPVPFPDAERPVGWLLRVGATCGNTSSGRYRLVTPRPWSRSPSDDRWEYVETTFESKFEPTARRVGDRVEIWGVTQDWGNGGTATSIFVPFRLIVRPDGSAGRPPLDPDLSTWPALERGGTPMAQFVAGLRSRNPDLMRSAKARWTERPPAAWQDAFGLATDDNTLDRLITGVTAFRRAERRLVDMQRSP